MLIVILGLLVGGQATDLSEFGFLLDSVPLLFVLLGSFSLVRSVSRNLSGPFVVIVEPGAWQLGALRYVTSRQVVPFGPIFIRLFYVNTAP